VELEYAAGVPEFGYGTELIDPINVKIVIVQRLIGVGARPERDIHNSCAGPRQSAIECDHPPVRVDSGPDERHVAVISIY
jgi:hypothetical protein